MKCFDKIFLVVFLGIFLSSSNVLAMGASYGTANKEGKFSFMINELIDTSKIDSSKTFEITNKYDGKYTVGVILDKFSDDLYYIPLAERYKIKLKLEVKFLLNDKIIKTYVTDKNYDPFIGSDGSGFILFFYTVPEDLPINKQITCEVRVIETDKVLYENWGPTSFFIKKISDR